MVIQKKKLRKTISLQLKIAFTILVLILFFKEALRPYFQSPVMEFVSNNLDFLKTLILYILLICSSILILIVWLLEWGDRKQKSIVTKFVSQLVCENYYGNYRKTNVYKAIKTALSKFSRNDAGEEVIEKDDSQNSPVRIIDTSRFKIKSYQQPQLSENLPTADTSDGLHKTFYANGNLKLEVSYKNNMLDGIYRNFYEDGTLHQERNYKAGKLEGIFKAFDEYGIPYFDIIYQNDKQHGITNIYYKNGVLQYRDTYKNGKRVHRETYNESGELKFSQKEDFL